VFIIDDADRFNDNSANAFLKTLEEPPEQLVFVLLAANSAQLLPTIISRCQTVRFSPLGSADLARATTSFENLPPSRELLLRVAQGSPGRVKAMLEFDAMALARSFVAAAPREPFRASEQLAAALAKGLAADAGVEGQRERLRDVLAVISAVLRDRMVAELGMADGPSQWAGDSAGDSSAEALVSALNRLELLRERIDGNANLKLACDVLALEYPA
jgi:DNA polymerase-3 subunit delta'